MKIGLIISGIGFLSLSILVCLKICLPFETELLNSIISGFAFIGFLVSLSLQFNESKRQNAEGKFRQLYEFAYKQIDMTNEELYRVVSYQKNKRIFDKIVEINKWLHKRTESNLSNDKVINHEKFESSNLGHLKELNNRVELFYSLFGIIDSTIFELAKGQESEKFNKDLIEIYLSGLNYEIFKFVLYYEDSVFDYGNNHFERNQLFNLRDILNRCKNIYPYFEKYQNIFKALDHTKIKRDSK